MAIFGKKKRRVDANEGITVDELKSRLSRENELKHKDALASHRSGSTQSDAVNVVDQDVENKLEQVVLPVDAPQQSVEEENRSETIVNEELVLGEGPFDFSAVSDNKDIINSRLDLGSVLVPTIENSEIQLDVDESGAPQSFYFVSDDWKISIGAFAAPKNSPQWKSVAADLCKSLKADGALVESSPGVWGEEIIARYPNRFLGFIGVDGPKWLLRCAISGEHDFDEIVNLAKKLISQTVVRRDNSARPALEPLPIVLPKELVQSLVGLDSLEEDEDLDEDF